MWCWLLAMAELRVPGRQRGPAGRPFLMSGVTGGQQANVQGSQGKIGFQTGGVYMSKDNGTTWERVNSVNPRPFYFSNVRIDPTDGNTVYVLGDTQLWKSTDGGKKFASAPAGTVHPDHHALWIDPKDGRHLILGCDGGFYPDFRPRRELGPSEHAGARPVLPCRGGHAQAVSRLRRLAR